MIDQVAFTELCRRQLALSGVHEGESVTVLSQGDERMHYADDLAGVIGALGLGDPIVLGHSMGARIAAAWHVLHGGRGPLVLADPPLSGPGRGPYPTSWAAFRTQLDEARRGTTPEEMRRFYPKWPERELLIRAQELPSCDETAVRETHEGFETEDFFPYWERIGRPAACGITCSATVTRATRS